MQTFGFEGYKSVLMVQEPGSKPIRIKYVPYGLNHAPQDFYQDMVKTMQPQVPDWVDPPEGIQDDTGGAVPRSARLPIPEGCLDDGPIMTWNGQSESGAV